MRRISFSMARNVHSQLPIGLSEIVEHRANAYSLGAIAAGVSLLALTQPAHSSIVVSKTNVTAMLGHPGFVDVNNDGKSDFEFLVSRGAESGHSMYNSLAVIPLTGGMAVGGARGPYGPYGSALASGAKIGPSAHFSSSIARGRVTLDRTSGGFSGSTSRYDLFGQWPLGTSKYLGVRFLINGHMHYGWIKLSVTRSRFLQANIVEYAYNTVAGQKISAGQTAEDAAQESAPQPEAKSSPADGASLGMLAAGIDGLALWRQHGRQGKSQPSTTLTVSE